LDASGIALSAHYLDKAEIKFAYNQLTVNFIPSSGLINVEEKNALLSGKYSFFINSGKISLQLDLYNLEDKSSLIDEIDIINPTLSFLNNSNTFYIDIGYSASSYHADNLTVEDLDIRQITPTLGLGWNNKFDWLQLRGYLIKPTQSNRLIDTEQKSALELKWIHWFETSSLNIDKVIISVLGGERLYAVDSDTNSVYNLADIQTGAASLSIQWKLGNSSHLILSGGTTDYEAVLTNEKYSSKYLYINVSTQW